METPFGDSPQDLNGLTVIDGEGHKVGSVQRVYKDDVSGAPEWVTVRTGLFGTKETFVPLADAHREEDKLRVPYTKERIKDAPRVDAESHLDAAEEKDLYRYYGRGRPASGTAGGGRDTGTASGGPRDTAGGQNAGMAGAGAGAGMGAGGMAMSRGREGGESGMKDKGSEDETRAMDTGKDTGKMSGSESWQGSESGRRATGATGTGGPRGMADREMTLSEERVDIATEEYESGHARLSKHVVTEEVTQSVPVSHEEVHMTRERLSDEERRAEPGRRAPSIEDGQVEITLHEERPVVRKEAVPVERIRLETERVTEQQEVSTEIRKEEAEFDDGMSERRGTRQSGTRGTGTKGTGTRGGPKGTESKGSEQMGPETKDTGGKGPGEFR